MASTDMARRVEPPTLLEGRRLGIDDLVLIGPLRHRLQNFPHANGVRQFIEDALATPDQIMHIAGLNSTGDDNGEDLKDLMETAVSHRPAWAKNPSCTL